MERAYCRLTVLAPRSGVDVALPVDVPVAELVPMVLELVGEPAGGGWRPEPWRLSGAAGGPLPPASTLGELGVLDGDLLRIGPDVEPPPAPVFDDPVDAFAATVAPGAGDRRFGAAAVLVGPVAAAALLAGEPWAGWSPLPAVLAAVGAVTAVGYAARLARRPDPPGQAANSAHRLAAVTAALAAVVLAATAGWTALPAGFGAAPLLAVAAAGTTAAAAQIALRVVAPALVGVVVTAVPVALAVVAVTRFGAAPAAAAAGVGAIALALTPALPRAALRLAGLPRPVVAADAGELVDADDGPDLLPADELAERADLARGYLAGLTGGWTVVAAAAAPLAATAGGWTGPAFAGVTAAVLGLRSRSFADPGPAHTLLLGAVAAGVGLAGVLAGQVGPGPRLVVAAALLAAAAVGAVLTGRSRPIGSPVSRRAVALLEGLLVAASVPLAFGVMDLYRIVRGL